LGITTKLIELKEYLSKLRLIGVKNQSYKSYCIIKQFTEVRFRSFTRSKQWRQMFRYANTFKSEL